MTCSPANLGFPDSSPSTAPKPGTGSYGIVRIARHRATGTPVAIKEMSKARIIEGHQLPHVLSERNILAGLNSAFIVNLRQASAPLARPAPKATVRMVTRDLVTPVASRGTFQDSGKIFLVMDYVPGGELFSLLSECGRLPEEKAKFYAAEVRSRPTPSH